ncbi:hypothetical protein ACH42_01670 [Endozoicomonas sp. (ex Bugula neritina AB1)]|nr:hypothetical protein ACH42_01670 [Endozoicomonas sp. (ex Bugula neritina AB1)]
MALAISISTHSIASPANQWQDGLSGEAAIMLGYTKDNSQFNTDNKTTDSLNSKGKNQNETSVIPLGSLQYTFDNAKSQLFAGFSRADITLGHINAEFGYRRNLEQYGVLAASVLPNLIANTTWADPYVTGQDRSETDSKTQALRIQYTDIFSTGFGLDLGVGERNIDTEKSGSNLSLTSTEQNQLKRDSKLLYAKSTYQTMVSRGIILKGGLSFLKNNADGDAMSSNTYGVEASIIRLSSAYSTAFSLLYDQKQFNAENPVFTKKQTDKVMAANLSFSYKEPFGLENWNAVALAGYQSTNSNINFYDSTSWRILTGLSYNF